MRKRVFCMGKSSMSVMSLHLKGKASMKFKRLFENQSMIISIFVRNAVSRLKSHFQENLWFACLLSYIVKPIFKLN